MGMTRNIRVRTGLLGLLGGSLLLTGCMGPTYGTDKTSGEQLIDDLGNAVMIQPDNKDAKKIRYQPRGSLVVPKGAWFRGCVVRLTFEGGNEAVLHEMKRLQKPHNHNT